MTKKHISKLEDHLGYWMRCLSNYVHHSFEDQLVKHDISVAGWVVLRVIYDTKNTTLKQAAELIGVDKSSLSRMVERLVKRGLLKRSNGENRRSIAIALTDDGAELVPKLALLADKNDEIFFKSLSVTKRQDLLDTIKQLLTDNGWEKSKRSQDTIE